MQEDTSNAAAVAIEQPDPVIVPGHTYGTVTDKISDIVLKRGTSRGWLFSFGASSALAATLLFSIYVLVIVGTGIWGINQPVSWGFAIINFVWWIGIGHAGTLISAILLLLKQDWRTSINRFAEAMTLFAVTCAGLFPILHTGRPWLAYWLVPYPNSMGMWQNVRSPLIWDVFAVTTYLTVSAMFWFIGLIPDLATMRDTTRHPLLQKVFAVASFGWRGSARHWDRYEMAYLLLAGLSTPLVLSVHSVVSLDFSVGIIPGWHATIFPPYFVAGAIFAGFAMVLTLAIPVRKIYGLEDLITMRHLECMGKLMLATGMIVVYGYCMELFMAWYSGNPYEMGMLQTRLFGPYKWLYYALFFCNALVPQLIWFKRFRRSPLWLFIVAQFVSIGMWLERFIIVVVSLHRDFLPSSWGMYYPTFWDVATYFGTFGLFFSLMLLFIRFVPMIAMFEVRLLVPPPASRSAVKVVH